MALAGGSRPVLDGENASRALTGDEGKRRRLTLRGIVAWAVAHREATGQWPTRWSGRVRNASYFETWHAIDGALVCGLRGLTPGQSLAQLLRKHASAESARVRDEEEGRSGAKALSARTAVRRSPRREPLNHEQILSWADAHFQAHLKWPTAQSGPVAAAPGENWGTIDRLLKVGGRGLRGGESIAKLLAQYRGRPIRPNRRPRLTFAQILFWADTHFQKHGAWPTEKSGRVKGALGESWSNIHHALVTGGRGLPQGFTLPRLFAEHRGRAMGSLGSPLDTGLILSWADAHHAATGRWPAKGTGPVAAAPGENWAAIDRALREGRRRLPGGSSLSRLLDEHRPGRRATLTVETILAWGRAHHAATGRWPNSAAGAVTAAPGETWSNIAFCLRRGYRGLPAGTSLRKLFDPAPHPNPAQTRRRPRLRLEQVLAWGDAYHAAHGRWPTSNSGPVEGAPEETWANLHTALRLGHRGLPSGTRLARLFAKRPIPAPASPPPCDSEGREP